MPVIVYLILMWTVPIQLILLKKKLDEDNFSEDSTKECKVEDTFDMWEYNRIYSPILSPRELSVFKELSFIIPDNPRSIKRILNIYSLARTYRLHKDRVDIYDILSRKIMKFIICWNAGQMQRRWWLK